jgi:hypothetical protein
MERLRGRSYLEMTCHGISVWLSGPLPTLHPALYRDKEKLVIIHLYCADLPPSIGITYPII